MEEVVLVDSRDRVIGVMEKLQAHKEGLLHRAFSVLLFNDKGEMLIQQRASDKYHSGGLWSNACCSHPRPKEDMPHAVKRRIGEELGISADTSFAYHFIYKCEFNNSLVEHELDHVYIGNTNTSPQLNPNEASDYKWVGWKDLLDDIAKNNDSYSFWFKIIINRLKDNSLYLPAEYRSKIY